MMFGAVGALIRLCSTSAAAGACLLLASNSLARCPNDILGPFDLSGGEAHCCCCYCALKGRESRLPQALQGSC
eukprot:5096787-Amphidinium_carterae.1